MRKGEGKRKRFFSDKNFGSRATVIVNVSLPHIPRPYSTLAHRMATGNFMFEGNKEDCVS